MTVRISTIPQGARVRVKQGSFPIDPGLLGAEGLVVRTPERRPGRYGVQITGERGLRDLAEDELEVIEGPKGS